MAVTGPKFFDDIFRFVSYQPEIIVASAWNFLKSTPDAGKKS